MTDRTHAAARRPARILIVDDEPLNVDYLEQELERHGFLTETAADGLEALERVAADPPDLVLLDVMMPRMDGLSALRILKEDSETRLIPVVLMTALNAVEDRVRGIGAGADDFLSKPVDDRELLARIETALDHKRAIEEAVGELRSTSAHLERYGRQTREVAVLVVEWSLRDGELPDDAVSFVARREREAAEELVVAGGGIPSEGEGGQLVAVFDGPDSPARAASAVRVALAVAGERSTRPETAASAPVRVSAAISVGAAEVGSTRVTEAAGPHWVYTATGEPVERGSDLARRAAGAGVFVTGDAAAVVSNRFRLERAGDEAYRVLGSTSGDGEAVAAPSSLDRRVRTVLVTDIVGSTMAAERVGDRAWGELVTAHERATRHELVLFGGDEIDTTGDGFVASFDSPAAAIRCALAVVDRVAALGLAVRAGVHAGEIEYVEGKPRGIALHVASRIAAKADGGEVLLSSTTRELAAGADLVFADRGEHVLRGVSEPRHLYAAAESRTKSVG